LRRPQPAARGRLRGYHRASTTAFLYAASGLLLTRQLVSSDESRLARTLLRFVRGARELTSVLGLVEEPHETKMSVG
jgi:hypothetical protein